VSTVQSRNVKIKFLFITSIQQSKDLLPVWIDSGMGCMNFLQYSLRPRSIFLHRDLHYESQNSANAIKADCVSTGEVMLGCRVPA